MESMSTAVLCELIGEPIKQSAKLTGEPIKGRVKRALRKGEAARPVIGGPAKPPAELSGRAAPVEDPGREGAP